ncbi:AraC family transcriptional regulator [Bowmanella dokdonensis]|uniref:AraC family transcriptional regulator n=1 Tax=Bowmanella dokdonensis TaxID=751969 RepID=A0A939DJC8_9ALTE|nr:AraC family transcriptional regulator [Bowmanella dokdonensis]MBN7823717.1 AraC family transcriptional regulator [Bowmanella dokdonensis]
MEEAGVKKIIAAFDLLPDILFWVKDTQSRIIYGNQEFVKHLGYRFLEQVLHKTDFDFSPHHLAHQFVTDDKRVLEGHQVTDRLELNHTASGELGWFSTSKRVLTDEQGRIIGTYGMTRHLEKTSKTLSNVHAVDAPVQYIREHFNKKISIEKLADLAHLSVSALERRFKKHLAKTPKQFINETRLENGRKMLLESRLAIADVAYQCGFSDPSYFSKQFHNLFGETPSKLRKAVTR